MQCFMRRTLAITRIEFFIPWTPCTITVQPAGPVGKRHVFVTLAFETTTKLDKLN
jgi:hypothetical protein